MKPTSKVYRTELTPVSFLERSASVFPDKVAVVHGERRYTYRQLEERANRLASALRRSGLARHDRVGFICPNTPAMLEAHYGVLAAGGVLVAINIRLASDEIGSSCVVTMNVNDAFAASQVTTHGTAGPVTDHVAVPAGRLVRV